MVKPLGLKISLFVVGVLDFQQARVWSKNTRPNEDDNNTITFLYFVQCRDGTVS